MLLHTLAIVALSCPLLAAATPFVARDAPTSACCANMEPANSAAGAATLKSVGASPSNSNTLVGSSCSPVNIIGVGTTAVCNGATVTCMDGIVKGVGVGCVSMTPL